MAIGKYTPPKKTRPFNNKALNDTHLKFYYYQLPINGLRLTSEFDFPSSKGL